MFAFSTSSSSATIPIVSLNNLEKNFNVKKKISSFTVPLFINYKHGWNGNYAGNGNYFYFKLLWIELVFTDFLTIILTATLASIGTAGVPGVGMIMLGMVLNQVGLPLEGYCNCYGCR